MSIKCLMNGLEVNYPCSPVCALFGDCVTAFEAQKKENVRTNADRIRSMTDEELAGWVDKWCRATDVCDECPLSDNCPQARVGVTTLDWLKQPYEEAEDGENQTV